MRPAFVLILLMGVCSTQAGYAQPPGGPFSNAKSIWETEPAEKHKKNSRVNVQNGTVQALKPQSLPEANSTPASQDPAFQPAGAFAPRSILPASYQQKTAPAQSVELLNHSSSQGQAVPLTRPALPLKKPGEKLSKSDKQGGADRQRLGSTSQQLGTTTLVLGGIIAVILLASRFMKKHTRLGTLNLSTEVLEVLGRKMLDQKHAIHYVLCGNRILILGTSLEGMRTLAEITDPVEIDRIRGECKPIPVESAIGNSFGFLLSKTERETEQVDLDRQHRKRQKKRGGSKRIRKDKNQPPAPDLADFGLNLDALREGRS